jgi:hypothetical protein
MNVNIRFFAFLLTLISVQGFSQQTKPFKVRHQGYVNGDMVLIANNIVNRVDFDDKTTTPYNDRTAKNKLNDECKMKYIDIDIDKTTFSSSSADLVMDTKGSKKIIYAGLYWSATYCYESGKMKKSGKYKAINDKREAYDQIKIKLPNQEEYSDVKGELIYDGIEDKDFKESAPYVMYADITEMVTNSKKPFGTYTVANVKSTTGIISGGISGGWSIFFVYEDPKMTGKYITTYDGFAGITDKSLDINFSGFQTLPEGKVNAKIACIALEGDLKLKGDQVLFKTSDSDDFTQLSNNLREKTNFFNSSITNDNDFFQNRIPNSLNTLGYDSFVMTIDNPNNTVVGNNTQDATVRLKTYGDRYFMFFNAFNVEVVPPENSIKEEIPDIVSNDCRDIEMNLLDKKTKTNKEAKLQVSIATNENKVMEPKINREKTKIIKSSQYTPNTNVVYKNISNSKNQVIENKSIVITPEVKGYYIIANVFSKQSNADRFIVSLKKKGIKAKYFINPANNYKYVYIIKEENLEVASNLHDSKINGQYNGDLWIMTVNKQEDSALVFEEN